MKIIKPPKFIRKFYPEAQWTIETSNKEIFLTFDDGPFTETSFWLEEQLNKYNAKATFFYIGKNILEYPEIKEKMFNAGHSLGNHSHTHLKGWKTSLKNYLSDIEECNKILPSKLFRPPYGKMTFKQYQKVKEQYKIIMWSVLSYDYTEISPEQCLKNTLKNISSGSIVVFHENYKSEKNMKYCVPIILDHFSNLGFTFQSI